MPPYLAETVGSASKATLPTPAIATTLLLMAFTAIKASSCMRIWTSSELQHTTTIYSISALLTVFNNLLSQTLELILSWAHG